MFAWFTVQLDPRVTELIQGGEWEYVTRTWEGEIGGVRSPVWVAADQLSIIL